MVDGSLRSALAVIPVCHLFLRLFNVYHLDKGRDKLCIEELESLYTDPTCLGGRVVGAWVLLEVDCFSSTISTVGWTGLTRFLEACVT